jgi:cytochrome P450
VVDVHREMVLATFDVICRHVAARSNACDDDGFFEAMEAYMMGTCRADPSDFLPWPLGIPTVNYMLMARHASFLRRAVENEIETFHAGGTASMFVERLSEAVDPATGERLTPRQIRDNILTFVIAGHDTMATTLAWALLLLALNEDLQEQARIEALSVAGPGGEKLADVHGRVPLCRRIFDETMRLYPAASMLTRVAREDDEILGQRIRKSDAIIVPIFALQRHARYWNEPHAFRPDRFAERPNRFVFLPFGGGPRVCVGASMAYMEADILLSAL